MVKNLFFDNPIEEDENTIGQNPQQNIISNNHNNENILEEEINQQNNTHMENTNIINNLNVYENESNKAKNGIIEKAPEQKGKNKIFKVVYVEMPKKPSNNMNKTKKNEDLSNININININESTKNKFPTVQNTNESDIINLTIFQYIIDTTIIINKRYENMKKSKKKKKNIYSDFKTEMNKKLIDIFGDYKIELPSDFFKKERIKEDVTISSYLKKLSNKIEKTDYRRELTIPKLKQIYRIINEMINNKNDNIINQENKKVLLKFDNKLLNKNLFNEDSNALCSFNNEISGNRKENENIFQKISKDRNITASETNLKSNYIDIDKSKNKKNKKNIREDNIINIIKDTIIKFFIILFNKVNQSYKLKSVKSAEDKKKKDDDRMEEEDNESIKENNNEDKIEHDSIGKEDFYKPIYLDEKENNLLHLIEDVEENSYEDKEEFDNEMEIEYDDKETGKINEIKEDIKKEHEGNEKDEKEITLYISIKNKNNTEEDKNFIENNFEDIIIQAKKKQNLEHLKEDKKAINLIKKNKYIFLEEILSDNTSKEKFFKKIQNDKENRWKQEICQEIAEEIVRRKDLKGLVIILFYFKSNRNKKIEFQGKDKDKGEDEEEDKGEDEEEDKDEDKDKDKDKGEVKDKFINEIKKLGGYEVFISKYDDIKNNIQTYMESVKYIVYNIVSYLNN